MPAIHQMNEYIFQILIIIIGGMITLFNGVVLLVVNQWYKKAEIRYKEEELVKKETFEKLIRIDEKLSGLSEIRVKVEGNHGRIRHCEEKITDLQHRVKIAEGRIGNLNKFCQGQHGMHLELDSSERS